jgi:hypothetical protein
MGQGLFFLQGQTILYKDSGDEGQLSKKQGYSKMYLTKEQYHVVSIKLFFVIV